MAELLLDLGANVNARDMEGVTPLGVAKRRCRPDTIELLVSRGAIE